MSSKKAKLPVAAKATGGKKPVEAPAAFVIVNPCGERCAQCAARVTYMFFVSFDIGCRVCGGVHPITDFLIIPV